MRFAKSPYQPLKQWLTVALVIVGLVALVYAAVQQDLRLSAYDPQIQLAEDSAEAMNAGSTTAVVMQNQPATVDPSQSLAPFLIIYDDSGHELASTGKLGGTTPALPSGVLDYTKAHGQDRFTWQPQPGVRLATVVVHSGSHFVLAARSLLEVERRIERLAWECAFAMVFLLAGTALLIRFFRE